MTKSLTGTTLINMPSGFKATRFGGWCSPLGVFYPRYANISSTPVLKSRGIYVPAYDLRWPSIDAVALYEGWFEVEYWQRKMTGLAHFDMSKTAKRKISINYCGQSVDVKQQRRILDVARFYLSFFDSGETILESRNHIFSIPSRQPVASHPANHPFWSTPIEFEVDARKAKKYPFFRLDVQKACQKIQINAEK